MSQRRRISFAALTSLAALSVLAVRNLETWICRVDALRTFDYGPALAAWLVHRLSVGEALYQDVHQTFPLVDVYNPLGFYLVWALSRFFRPGPMSALEGGRVLTILSTLMVCLAVWALARRSGVSGPAAAIAALTFAIAPILEPWGFEFRVDMLALAFDMIGLWAFWQGLTYWSVGLFALSFLTKQNQLTGIAAVVLFLLLRREVWRAVVLGGLWAALVAGIVFVLHLVWPFYLQNAFGGLTSLYDIAAPADFLILIVFAHFAIVVLCGTALFAARRELGLIACFLLAGLVQAVLSSLHWCSYLYYFLSPLAAATCLAAGKIEDLLIYAEDFPRLAQIWFGLALTFVIVCQDNMPFSSGSPPPLGLRALAASNVGCASCNRGSWEDAAAIQFLRSVRGTVLSDEPFLPFEINPDKVRILSVFFLHAAVERGHVSEQALLLQIKERRLAAIALFHSDLGARYRIYSLLWPRLEQAIAENYSFVPGIGPPYVLLPNVGHPTSAR